MEGLTAGSTPRELFASAVHSIIERGADPKVRAAMNFKYISFDWVAPGGWFFWPRRRRGVYQLRSRSCAHDGDAGFSLYYYPHPDEDVFGGFSLAEQLARVSELFSREGVKFFEGCPEHGHCDCEEEPFPDLRAGKGIPLPDARERLAASLYWVGAVTCGWLGGELAYLTLEAPGRARTWAIADIPGPQGGEPLLRAGDLDRDVPCWRLAWPFVNTLAADLGRSVRFIRRREKGGADGLKHGVLALNRR